MSPTCSLDAPAIGPVFILENSFDDKTCRIVVPVHTNLGVIDAKTLRDIEMSTFDLDVPPTVALGDEEGTLVFEFDPDTVEETIPTLLNLIFEQLAVRIQRHRDFLESGGPSLAISSEFKVHG